MTRVADERRRLWGLLAGAAVVVVVLVLVLTRGTAEEPAPPSTEPSPTATLSPAPPPSEPVRLPERGAYVDSVVRADGTVRVTHWIRGSSAIAEITLRAHAAQGAPSDPEAEDLVVRTSQGEVVPPVDTVGTEPVTLDLVRPSLLVKLTYTLTDVATMSSSPPGRALIGIVDLDVSYDGRQGRDRLQVGGRDVLQLSCTAPDADPGDVRPCGKVRDGGWAVNLIGRELDDRVSAQVDLRAGGRGDAGTTP